MKTLLEMLGDVVGCAMIFLLLYLGLRFVDTPAQTQMIRIEAPLIQ